MPINKRKDGKGDKEIEKIGFLAALGGLSRAAGVARGISSATSDEEDEEEGMPINVFEMSKQKPDWTGDLQELTNQTQQKKPSDGGFGFAPDELNEAAKQRAQQARDSSGNPTEESVEETKQQTQKKIESYKKRNEKARQDSLEAYGEDSSKLFGLQNFLKDDKAYLRPDRTKWSHAPAETEERKKDDEHPYVKDDPRIPEGKHKPQSSRTHRPVQKEDGGAGRGTVAVSSDPGVFTETYGARKRKIMNRTNPKTKKSEKSGPEKLDDYLSNTMKAIDDETFLVELITHVREELQQEDSLRKAGEGPHGTYTPLNERPDRPPDPQEIKRKGKGRSEEINTSPTTENTVPVSTGAGALGQSNIPQETAMAEVGVDDSRNMNRKNAYNSEQRRKNRKRAPSPTGMFLNPGDESGNNFQDTAVPFTAMQKIGTHGNVTANTPKQFSTQRPQEQYIERKPRSDPNSDIEQEEFVGNVDSIKDEDKNRKGRTYENNKEGNNFNTNQIDTYTANMGGHALQAFEKEMRDVGIDSLHRESDDDITEPDDNEDIPSTKTKDLLQAEKSAVRKMLEWMNGLP